MSRRRLILLCVMLLLLGCFSGCSQLRNARPITDVHQLEGQRVGVAMGWAPDYLLTGREDMTLVRYNYLADMVTALCFQRVDAICVEQPTVPLILESVQGVRCIEEPLTTDGVTALISPERADLLEEFNTFIADFVKTPEFLDLDARSRDMNGFVPAAVPASDAADRVLQVGVVDDAYPFSYVDFVTGEYAGIDVEFIRWFAYEYGYTLEFHGGNWEAMDLGVCNNLYDIGIGGVSDLYRGDYEKLNMCLVSDVYIDVDLLFIEIEDPEALAIVSNIEE